MKLGPNIHRPICVYFLIMGIFVLSAIAALRIPFLSNVLIGEEGSFAYLVLDPLPVVRGLDAIVVGRIDGIDRLIFPEHSIIMYKLLDTVGRQIGRLLPICQNASMDCTTIRARSPFLVLFLCGIAIAMLATRRMLAFGRPRTFAIQLMALFYIASAPLLVAGSIQPQIDGALGVVILATSAAFILAFRSDRDATHPIFLFLSGLTSAFGKDEWVLGLSGTLFTVSALAICFSFNPKSRRWNFVAAGMTLKICFFVFSGVIVGQFLIYSYSPGSYLAGLGVMSRIDAMKLSTLDQIRRTWILSYPVFLACGLALALIALKLKRYSLCRPTVIIIAGWAAVITIGYAYSGFSGDGLPRYYCPAAILAAIALICIFRELALRQAGFVAAVLVLGTGIGFNLTSLLRSYERGVAIASSPGTSLERVKNRYVALAKAYRGNPILEWSPIGVYFRNVDWISSDLGEKGAALFLRQLRPEKSTEFQKLPE